jgi:hypothetical protein
MKIPSKNDDLDKLKNAEQILLRKMNGLAMSALHSACRDHVSFNAINNAISEDVPQDKFPNHD